MGTNFYIKMKRNPEMSIKIVNIYDYDAMKLTNGFVYENTYYSTEEEVKKAILRTYKEGSDDIHIGKRSSGWLFLMQTYPERDINKLEDFFPLLDAYSCLGIFDEYNRELTKEKLIEEVAEAYKYHLSLKDKQGHRYEDYPYHKVEYLKLDNLDVPYCTTDHEFI